MNPGTERKDTTMPGYQSLQVSPDGADYVTDYHCATVAEVWDLVNDQGSRWYFYPLPFVITSDGKGYQSGVAILRKQIVSACDGFEYLEGLTVATAMREISDRRDTIAQLLSL